MLHAVIGIGSNSTRLLIANIEEGNVSPVLRVREGTRLFAGLTAGVLSGESMRRTAAAAAGFAARAREADVQSLSIIATSAARDAENGASFCDLVEALAGVRPQILTGEEEGRLSFLGCAGTGYCGMLDLGGGSTEIAVGGESRTIVAASAQLGAVRLSQEVPDLTGGGLDLALSLSEARAAEAWASVGAAEKPVDWYGVGGTLTCLASMDMRLPMFDRDAVDGHPLRRSAVEGWAERLAGMTVEQRREIPGILPQRADIIAHGAAALLGVMRALGLARVTVSNRTNLDGFLRDLASANAVDTRVRQVQSYYDASVEQEWDRLEKSPFEFEINKRYIDRYVKPGDRVLDVGGGPGRYSLHLAARGAEVTLVDLSGANIAFARDKAIGAEVNIRALQGDARDLDAALGTADAGAYDAILLMGPLYHLLDEGDRVRAVEACLWRLKPGGVLFAAFISTVAAMIYAARELPESILWEGEDTLLYERILAREDYAGPAFTQAYFIAPERVAPFMARFPLAKLHLIGSEGIAAPFMKTLGDTPPDVRARWLALSMAMCEREDFHTFAEHFLYIGRKKEDET